MHSSLTAVVLCILAQAAAAECVASATQQGSDTVRAVIVAASSSPSTFTTPAAPSAITRPGGELIKTAAAGTRDTPAVQRETAAMVRPARHLQDDEDPAPRSGTAMLLAALALMSGIALRRYSSGSQ